MQRFVHDQRQPHQAHGDAHELEALQVPVLRAGLPHDGALQEAHEAAPGGPLSRPVAGRRGGRRRYCCPSVAPRLVGRARTRGNSCRNPLSSAFPAAVKTRSPRSWHHAPGSRPHPGGRPAPVPARRRRSRLSTGRSARSLPRRCRPRAVPPAVCRRRVSGRRTRAECTRPVSFLRSCLPRHVGPSRSPRGNAHVPGVL